MEKPSLKLSHVVLEHHRKKILTELAKAPRLQANFIHELGWKTRITWHHFNILLDAGLIEHLELKKKEDRYVPYKLTDKGKAAINDFKLV